VDLEGEIELGGHLSQLLERLEEARTHELDRMRVEEDRRQIVALCGELDGGAPKEPAELGLGANVLGDAEEIERALGQRGVTASPERLVRGHRAQGEKDDGLKHHRHELVPEQLAHLAGALLEVVGQLPARGHHGGGSLFVDRHRTGLGLVDPAHTELEIGEVDDVFLVERGTLDPPAIDEGPVLAAQAPEA